MTVFLRLRWKDARLAWNDSGNFSRSDGFSNLDSSYAQKLWIPDIFFTDEKETIRHDVISKNILLSIGGNGQILYSERFSVRVSCYMILDYKFF